MGEPLGSFLDSLVIEPGLLAADESWGLEAPAVLQPSPCPPRQASQPRGLPSPYRNYLQIQTLNFQAARMQNLLYLGVPQRLADKTGWTLSPWYWHAQFDALFSLPPPAQEHILRAFIGPKYDIFIRPVPRRPCFQLTASVMPDLDATPLQRSHPHSAYLDAIPFPVFRDRVITLLSMDPLAFDEDELKRDIEAEGLLVWGVGQGARDRTASLVRDKRNWECAKWFSSKWRLLVDGSGLEEQSRWWRMMRGDDGSDDET